MKYMLRASCSTAQQSYQMAFKLVRQRNARTEQSHLANSICRPLSRSPSRRGHLRCLKEIAWWDRECYRRRSWKYAMFTFAQMAGMAPSRQWPLPNTLKEALPSPCHWTPSTSERVDLGSKEIKRSWLMGKSELALRWPIDGHSGEACGCAIRVKLTWGARDTHAYRAV